MYLHVHDGEPWRLEDVFQYAEAVTPLHFPAQCLSRALADITTRRPSCLPSDDGLLGRNTGEPWGPMSGVTSHITWVHQAFQAITPHHHDGCCQVQPVLPLAREGTVA